MEHVTSAEAVEEPAMAEEQRAIEPIAFPEQPEEEHELSKLDQERLKHKARAEKFGTEYVEPARRRDLRLDARKERFNRPGFATGIDLFTEEEAAKRAQRASRFNMPAGSGLEWKPPVADQDEDKRRQRAERFGVDYKAKDETGLMDVDLFEARKDPSMEVPRRHEALHIYGVDLLSTSDLLKHFADYGPKFVEWINDSSANIVFADGATAKRAVAGMGTPLSPEEAPEQLGIDPTHPASLPVLWHKGEDYVKQGSPIPLIFRIATVEDVKPADRVPSRRLWIAAGGGGGQQQQRHQQQHDGGDDQQQRRRRQPRYKARGGGRPAGWLHDDRGEAAGEAEGGGGGSGGPDAAAEGRQRKQRRPRGKRQRRGEGDVEMVDADAYDGQVEEGDHQAPSRFRRDDDEREQQVVLPAAAALAGPAREQVSYGDL
ncbi:hypothetical protein D9Q98_003388 [Chlorella vulgaris]|uniref:Uncharacterized protein n=1 Tax=Chlorella vulgaris TaxID=3077 RepID=A0A9D4YYF8_CHLVU|nr:hypothetical protein D9Q98_003388 [Chlorella vulgaris]